MPSRIEWTTETWNPIVGCSKVSAGCKFCYAKVSHDRRHKAYLEGKKMPEQYALPFETVQTKPERLAKPLRWRKPKRVFVNSISDLFHEDISEHYIDAIFAVMAASPQHVYQVLTKRPERMRDYVTGLQDNPERLSAALRWAFPPESIKKSLFEKIYSWHKGDSVVSGSPLPLPNLWLGVSVESPKVLHRVDALRQTPASVRWLSCEPLLEPLYGLDLTAIDWLVAGGETGKGARPCDPDWLRALRDACQAAGVPFFLKQMAKRREIPSDLLIRDFP